jgi:hypothetical protein
MTTIKRKASSVQMNSNDHRGAKGGLRRLRRPRFLITAAALACVAALPFAAGAAANRPSLARPNALQNFKLKLNDSRATAGLRIPTFSRTPSFAWAPVRGATRYEFELSTSKNFGADNAVIWSSSSLRTPAVAGPISLPWITGDHTSLYWHVRAFGADGAFSSWSQPQSFNMRWSDVSNKDNADDDVGVPQKLPSAPGYVRWNAVPGATAYDVWFLNLGRDGDVGIGKVVSTITTVADEREYYTMRTPPQQVEWRVRARRDVYGETQNGLPRASYGPWSGEYTTIAGAVSPTPDLATPTKTVSAQFVSDNGSVQAHALMPAFVFSRDGYDLHRVYIATDRDCVNIVHVGSIVGGTVYAPRVSLPLALNPEKWDPTHSSLLNGVEGTTRRADGEEVTSNEAQPKDDSAKGTAGSAETTQGPPHVDLWDTISESGRYYWTVVPVTKHLKADASDSNSPAPAELKTDESNYEYQDLIVPQDACQAGHVQMFKKRSTEPVLSAGAPYVTGLSPSGRLLSASGPRSSFYGAPLVAWTPSSGATKYDLEWSRTSYPWHAAGRLQTEATSALLTQLAPGTWYYRVRGIDPWLPKNASLRWSGPMRVQIAPPTFTVSGG